jgi:hypothetical protein
MKLGADSSRNHGKRTPIEIIHRRGKKEHRRNQPLQFWYFQVHSVTGILNLAQ